MRSTPGRRSFTRDEIADLFGVPVSMLRSEDGYTIRRMDGGNIPLIVEHSADEELTEYEGPDLARLWPLLLLGWLAAVVAALVVIVAGLGLAELLSWVIR